MTTVQCQPIAHTPTQRRPLLQGRWAGVESRHYWRRDTAGGEDRTRTRSRSLNPQPQPLGPRESPLLRRALLALLPDHFPDRPLPAN